MERRKEYIVKLLPVIISSIIAYIILLGGNKAMINSSGVIAIVVSLIGVIGAIVGTLIQLKRDGKTIDNTKEETSKIYYQTKDVDKISEYVTEKIPNKLYLLDNLDENIKKAENNIYEISKEIEFQKRLREDSNVFMSKDKIKANIDNLFYENMIKDNTILELQKENSHLKEILDYKEKEVKELKSKIISNNKKQQGLSR